MSHCLSSFLQASFTAKKASGESPARRDAPNYPSDNNALFSVETEQLFYVYDAGGAEVATYKKLVQVPNDVYALQYHTLYGAGRVGLLDKSTGKALYELSDHLGNVRAVVVDNGSGVAETVSYTDYFPHGSALPGRSYQSSLNFPYGYQGQEKDQATGLTNFELRQYDPRIGRWYNPDPYGQHHSPYLAMSNNPVSNIDPDGGWDGDSGYDNAMPGIIDRNKNDFLAQSFGASGQPYNWMATSPADREMMQKFYGTDYNSTYANRFYEIASNGGYTAQDGSIYNLDGSGNLSRTTTRAISFGTSYLSGGTFYKSETSFISKIGTDWAPLPKWLLKTWAAAEYCPTCSDGQLENVAGSVLENTFHAWAGENFKGPYVPNRTKFGDVVPDGISVSVGYENKKIITGESWWEVKATKKRLTLSSYQIKKELDQLSMRKSNQKSYNLITTSDVTISDKSTMLKYATNKKIYFSHMKAEYQISTSGQIKIRFTMSYSNFPMYQYSNGSVNMQPPTILFKP